MDHITSITNLMLHLSSNRKKLNKLSIKEMKNQFSLKDYLDQRIPNRTPMRTSIIGDHLSEIQMTQMMMTTITDPPGEDHPITLGIMGEDGTLEDLVEIMDFLEEAHQMEDPQEEDHRVHQQDKHLLGSVM